ncbi:MAG TPA: response regulator transcription factor [Solirubrobacteraceae bacterium]|nr:response regulator transcription factor [Solirubrobacteraceae bacterium]
MASNLRLSVLVADDHPMYREGVVSVLRRRAEIESVAEAGSGREALEAIARAEPDVALLDIQMADLDGVQVARVIERESRSTRTLFLSAYYDQEIVYKALAAGAAGYLSKDARGNEIADAVVAVARGETVLGRDIQAAVAQRIRQTAERTGPSLSARERQVLELVATGLSSPEVAQRLNLSTTTVKTHLQRIYEKLGVGDRAAAVAEAMRQHLLE